MLNLHVSKCKGYQQRALFPEVHIQPEQTWDWHGEHYDVCNQVRDSVYRKEDAEITTVAMWYCQVPERFASVLDT